jgi:hypothetical protein
MRFKAGWHLWEMRSQSKEPMAKFPIFGFAFFVAYWTSYLLLWARVSFLRSSTLKAAALPTAFSLFLGTAALGYLWSGRHRQANDPKLTQLVFATRITQVLIPVGFLVIMNS